MTENVLCEPPGRQLSTGTLVAAVLMGLLVGLPVAWGAPPNVVMIISDDQAWTDFGFMGHPSIETPHLDRLARESLVFSHGYVPSSLCRPSLATMITGLYPHQHAITSNDPPLPRGPEFLRARQAMIDHIDRVATLPRVLQAYGYKSLQTGKWWEGHPARGGFTHAMTHGDPDRGGRHGDEGLKIGREGLQPIWDFLDEVGSDPFFLWYAPFLPHAPHTPPQRLLDKYMARTDSLPMARYWACCEWFDETIGALRAGLESRGVAEHTIVLFVTDNGWIQSPDSPRYAPRSKRSPYDGGLRTPIMVHWPGRVPAAWDATPVSSIDLVPTIVQAVGAEWPAALPGVDLLDADTRRARAAVYGEVFSHNAVDIARPLANLQYRWVRRGPWKLIVPQAGAALQLEATVGESPSTAVELFHLEADPYERHNLAEQRPEQRDQLQKLLDAWWH